MLSCRDSRFSDLDVGAPLLRFKGLGELDEGGVCIEMSSIAKDSYMKSDTCREYCKFWLTLFIVLLDIFLSSLFLNSFACEPIRTRSPIFLMPISFK